MKASTGLRNALLGTASLSTALSGGQIMIYSGTVPTDGDQALGSAVLLCTIKNGSSGITFGTAAAGVIPKNSGETWSGTNVSTGTASFYRHVLSSDAGTLSTTALRLQGLCGTAGSDLNMTSLSLTSGATQTVDFYSVGLPVGS